MRSRFGPRAGQWNLPLTQGNRIWLLWGDVGACGAAAGWIPRVVFSVGPSSWKSSSPALPRSLIHGQNNARHDLHELRLIALCTILTGGKEPQAQRPNSAIQCEPTL